MASIYRLNGKWRAQVRPKNKAPISRVFATKAEAVAWARETEAAPPPTAATYADLHAAYVATARPGGSSKQWVLAHLLKHWGSYRLSEITTVTISNYIIARSRDVSPATILTDLSYFGTVVQHGGILLGNDGAVRAKGAIAAAIKSHRALGTVRESVERDRRPTEEELRRLEEHLTQWSALVAPVWDIVLIALTTAMRLGEICGEGGIRWEDFDASNRLLTVRARKDPTTPGGRDETIPLLRGPVTLQGNLIDPVEVLLRQQGSRSRNPRIFPFVENTPSQAFKRACVALGIEDLRFHDLRHDAISRLFEYGYSIPEVARVSGHKSWKHLQRYTQIDPATLHRRSHR